MSYFAFLLLFVLPPVVVLILTRPRPLASVGHGAGFGLTLIAAVALAYTTPWDNYLVRKGVWSYGEDRVIGTIGNVPVEEYLFVLLQTLLAGLWLYRLLPKDWTASPDPKFPRTVRVLGTLAWLLLGLVGLLLLPGWGPGLYMGLILAWAGPVLAVQWAYGGDFIWRRRRSWLLGAAVPTVYLWFADRLAIASGTWRISEEYSTGFEPLGLPVEEAVFFAATNLMVVGGLLAFLKLAERRRRRQGGATG